MDQVVIRKSTNSKGIQTVYADPKSRGFKDLLVKGGSFYAVYNTETHLWSRDIEDLSRFIDQDIQNYPADGDSSTVHREYMDNMHNGAWTKYLNSLKNLKDSSKSLNQKIIFESDEPKLEDYATFKVPYTPVEGDISNYDLIMSTLYSPEERRKLEWGIGALVYGKDLDKIQKMYVIYGDPGSGKSTVLDIMEQLFPGYLSYFSADELGRGYQFATSAFKNSPLVAIQHDGDLSKMWDNATINQIVSHETININEKGIRQYPLRLRTMLFMATNKPVKITDSKSGLLRRLIDIQPTGDHLPADIYFSAMDKIKFELGAIAYHCKNVYLKYGYSYYNGYYPTRMVSRTNDIYNFIEDNLSEFTIDGDIKLSHLWKIYRSWCEESNIQIKMKRTDFMYELETYFDNMHRTTRNQNSSAGVSFNGFKIDKIIPKEIVTNIHKEPRLELNSTISEFDKLASDYPAQYARNDEVGTPISSWNKVTTKLKDIDTHKLHWVQVPENHIVIDFDLRGKDGEKSLDENLKAAAKFPATYAEISKSGKGIHLHYIYDGDVTKLKPLYDTNIEVKVYKGNSSLRRKLSKCNNLNVNHISSGLPLKGEKSLINSTELKDEQHLRALIRGNLEKKYHPGTKPSIDFIAKILDEAYESGMPYDVRDMRNSILQFAMKSTHWSDYCVGVVSNMHFVSDSSASSIDDSGIKPEELIFFDVEVFPNLFLICWKKHGNPNIECWKNPPREYITTLLNHPLVGFNNRKYDNHILYAWGLQGYNNEQLYELSKSIVDGDPNALFNMAYGLSYADIYDYSVKKQSLKKWEIELGIDHHELGFPWDQPVPKEKWRLVEEYCKDDVRATEFLYDHLPNDLASRRILSAMSGLSINHTTNQHTTQIIFGDNRHPQDQFNYPDLSELFPGYTFDTHRPKEDWSLYMGEHPSEGGYVWVYGMENGDEDQDYKDIVPYYLRPDYHTRKVDVDA